MLKNWTQFGICLLLFIILFIFFSLSELLKFESPNEFEKETWTLNAEEKMAKVPKLREEGNELYKEKMYEEAAEKYAEALGILEQLMVQ